MCLDFGDNKTTEKKSNCYSITIIVYSNTSILHLAKTTTN